jgi:hypothetical protein
VNPHINVSTCLGRQGNAEVRLHTVKLRNARQGLVETLAFIEESHQLPQMHNGAGR